MYIVVVVIVAVVVVLVVVVVEVVVVIFRIGDSEICHPGHFPPRQSLLSILLTSDHRCTPRDIGMFPPNWHTLTELKMLVLATYQQ